jgi:excisionase family DNA binding protein
MNEPSISVSDKLRLLTETEVCELLNIPKFKFQKLRRRRLIPLVKLGYRTLRYDPSDVRRALDRLKVKAVS